MFFFPARRVITLWESKCNHCDQHPVALLYSYIIIRKNFICGASNSEFLPNSLKIITFWCSLTNVKFRLSPKLLGVYNKLRFNARINCVWISMAFTALIRRNGSWCNHKFEYFKINFTSGSLRNGWYLPEKLHKLTHLKQIYNDWLMSDWIYHRKQEVVLY